MSNSREQAFKRLMDILKRHSDAHAVNIIASLPEEDDDAFDKRIASQTPFEKKVSKALRLLDSLMPMERDPDQDVWESLAVEFDGHSGYLVVENRLGKRDHVTTWFLKPVFGEVVEDWSKSREESIKMSTPWDDARKERHTVQSMGQEVVIDRGANFVCDLLRKAGCEPFVSCEGHPAAAYFGFRGEEAVEEALRNEFARLGWSAEIGRNGGSLVYMKPVKTVAERDAEWRRLALEFDYGISNKSFNAAEQVLKITS
jgi:hypothetical protein